MSQAFTLSLVSVLLLGIFAQWTAWRIRLPAIVLLAGAGLLVGPGLGWIQPERDFGPMLDPAIRLAVAVILFEGGLNLRFHELREAGGGVRRLVYFGAPLNWLLGTLAAHYVGGLSWEISLVFGAIVVVTGPTVIMPLLRQAALNRRTANYLKWEGIINDPIGALLAVLVFQYLVFAGEGTATGDLLRGLGFAVLGGTLLGGGTGWVLGRAFRRGAVPEYLKMPMALTMVLAVKAVADLVQHEAGLLAVTVMGVVMGNMGLPSIQEMRRFKEYITIVLVSAVFVVLSARLETETLARLDWQSVFLVLAIMLVARPLAVYLATIGAGMKLADRVLVGWVGPRGIVAAAVAGLFGPELVAAGYPDGELLAPLIFALIFATVLVHGGTLGVLGRRLGLAASRRNRVLIVGSFPWTVEFARTLQSLDVKVTIVDNSWHRLKPARLAGVDVFYGEILSDFADRSLELNDVGTLLAATSNDAYNALVCTAFATELGRDRVFQLPMYARDETDPKGVARTVRGRIAFDEEAMYEDLWRRHNGGWTFQKTRLTETYAYEEFTRDLPESAIQLLLIRDDNDVILNSPQHPVAPREGDTVLYFAPARRDPAQPRSRAESTGPGGSTQPEPERGK